MFTTKFYCAHVCTISVVHEQTMTKGAEWEGKVRPQYLFDKLKKEFEHQIQLINLENTLIVTPLNI